jgi:hypothetical protein
MPTRIITVITLIFLVVLFGAKVHPASKPPTEPRINQSWLRSLEYMQHHPRKRN